MSLRFAFKNYQCQFRRIEYPWRCVVKSQSSAYDHDMIFKIKSSSCILGKKALIRCIHPFYDARKSPLSTMGVSRHDEITGICIIFEIPLRPVSQKNCIPAVIKLFKGIS